MAESLEADYVIVGCGAVGMAFADVLVRHTTATVILIDRQDRPGGHWTHAYPFVRLHLPSHFYGAVSLELGDREVVRGGPNDGLLHMASGAEIAAYYERLMERVLLPTGRVTFLPMSDCEGAGTVTSLVSGERLRVTARKKWVDAAYAPSPVPATHRRNYKVVDGMICKPVNDLPDMVTPSANYCIIGSGKTGMDACAWLLAHCVAPDRIRWIVPRDAWWIDRSKLQWSDGFLDETLGFLTAQMDAVSEAATVDELFIGFERRGIAHRLDPGITPTMYHNATVTTAEVAELRRVRDVVRLGRVRSIERDRLILEGGTLPAQATGFMSIAQQSA